MRSLTGTGKTGAFSKVARKQFVFGPDKATLEAGTAGRRTQVVNDTAPRRRPKAGVGLQPTNFAPPARAIGAAPNSTPFAVLPVTERLRATGSGTAGAAKKADPFREAVDGYCQWYAEHLDLLLQPAWVTGAGGVIVALRGNTPHIRTGGAIGALATGSYFLGSYLVCRYKFSVSPAHGEQQGPWY